MTDQANSLENILQELATAPTIPLVLIAQCSCHIINPKVHRLILWANTNKETGSTEYTLRIGSQRFTSLANTDKLGQTYWRFQSAGFYPDQQETISQGQTLNENNQEDN